MEKFLLFICLTTSCSLSTAQSIIFDDFEGNGTINSWAGDDCGLNTSLPNPQQTGINSSSTVLEYHDTGGQYANIRFDVAGNFDLATDHRFTLKIYIPSSGLTGSAPNQISLKLQDGTLPAPWSTQCEIIKPVSLDEWQEVSFDFGSDNYINLDGNSPPPTQRSDFNRVLIQVNGENNNDQVLAYIDDVAYDGSLPTEPEFGLLVWADEFNGNGMIDTSKWFHQTQLPDGNNWYNGEIQHYTDRIENARQENGTLRITARKETYTNQGVTKTHTSARLNSKFAFTYGRVEIRAKLPSGAGTWPAIWMLGKNIDEPGAYWQTKGLGTTPWPACGEIDIMEHWGSNQNYVSSAMHTPSSFGGTVNVGGQVIPTASTTFHVYALEWTADKMVFSVDDVVHYTYEPSVQNPDTWPFDSEQYLILNVAILPEISANFDNSAMEIDYLRVYQESANTALDEDLAPTISIFPNPVTDILTVHLSAQQLHNLSGTIYGANGQRLLNVQGQRNGDSITFQGLSQLPAGMYILEVRTGTDQMPVRVKFVRE